MRSTVQSLRFSCSYPQTDKVVPLLNAIVKFGLSDSEEPIPLKHPQSVDWAATVIETVDNIIVKIFIIFLD